jgi:hypothetical protein
VADISKLFHITIWQREMVNHIKYAAVYCVFIDESEPRGANGLAEGAEYTE